MDAIETHSRHIRKAVRERGGCFEGGVHVRWLFHRPSVDAAAPIMNEYYRPSCTLRSIWGHGTNFARDAVFADGFDADDRSGESRQLLMNLVVSGLFCLGDPSYKQPPLLGHETDQRYHSLVDDVSNPEIFVLGDNAPVAAMPGYLITSAGVPRALNFHKRPQHSQSYCHCLPRCLPRCLHWAHHAGVIVSGNGRTSSGARHRLARPPIHLEHACTDMQLGRGLSRLHTGRPIV